MSRSFKKHFFYACECCDYSKKSRVKNNQNYRRSDKCNLKQSVFDKIASSQKSFFKYFKDFRVPKRKRNATEYAESLARYKANNPKEYLALKAKYKHRLLAK